MNSVTGSSCCIWIWRSCRTSSTASVAEITNTPWRERHTYVLPVSNHIAQGTMMQFEFAKEFHVSPFWPMDMRHDWRLTLPDDRLHIHMENWRAAHSMPP